MNAEKLIVSDIDGTLLRDGEPTTGLEKLREMMDVYKGRIALVCATGRSFKSTWELIQSGRLATPDAVAPFLGTEVWFPNWQKADSFYQETLRHDWNRDAVEYLGRRIPGLVLQEPEFQSPFKVSFYITSKQKMYDLKQLLDNNYLRVRAIYSCGKYLDVIPVNGGKRKAINYLSQVWKIDPSNILTCGDSGNDLDMLCNPQTQNIAVGNAREEIAALRHTGLFYRAVSRFASGLLEGAEAFGFWPDTKSHRRSYGSLNP